MIAASSTLDFDSPKLQAVTQKFVEIAELLKPYYVHPDAVEIGGNEAQRVGLDYDKPFVKEAVFAVDSFV